MTCKFFRAEAKTTRTLGGQEISHTQTYCLRKLASKVQEAEISLALQEAGYGGSLIGPNCPMTGNFEKCPFFESVE